MDLQWIIGTLTSLIITGFLGMKIYTKFTSSLAEQNLMSKEWRLIIKVFNFLLLLILIGFSSYMLVVTVPFLKESNLKELKVYPMVLNSLHIIILSMFITALISLIRVIFTVSNSKKLMSLRRKKKFKYVKLYHNILEIIWRISNNGFFKLIYVIVVFAFIVLMLPFFLSYQNGMYSDVNINSINEFINFAFNHLIIFLFIGIAFCILLFPILPNNAYIDSSVLKVDLGEHKEKKDAWYVLHPLNKTEIILGDKPKSIRSKKFKVIEKSALHNKELTQVNKITEME
ncbi:hypothetical protein J2S78_002035 [Salibacterium salarium]|uniref:hypothetical protein n=1 Tax=Salibacterium salarium TaxID=284579 RepID=UPI002785D9B1|nr:hypothetical protein [Salibacterium salarium]MDQ0299615.1 hypothetical protein [Salibacterium salarium]